MVLDWTKQIMAFAGLLVLASCMETTEMRLSAAGLQQGPAAEVARRAPDSNQEVRFQAFVTGYGYWDNTPPGSAAIARPVIHRRAGGTGTYEDPITLAVGHRIDGGRQTLDFPEGTRFYISRLRKYAIVEDVCGDGARPQNGPCHSGYNGNPWIDLYVGGARQTSRDTEACARRITALQSVVMNPRPDYPVVAGELTGSGCRTF